ncbi:Cytosolic sulfotransferase 5 [Linum grandiflorum]
MTHFLIGIIYPPAKFSNKPMASNNGSISPSSSSFCDVNVTSDVADNNPLDKLPKERFWGGYDLYQWQGTWFSARIAHGAMAFQSNFQARDDDIIIASFMKTGSTWLKALCFSILNQPNIKGKVQDGTEHVDNGEKINGDNEKQGDEEMGEDPFAKNHPAFYVRTLEVQVYTQTPFPDLSEMASPRLLHTHLMYDTLPESIKKSSCRIVYITRNPKDTVVSLWHFLKSRMKPEQGPCPFDEEVVEGFCRGVVPSGPFFEHVVGYWKESQKNADKILFLKYEDLKRDPIGEVKKLAGFIGRPLKCDEEAEKVVKMCELKRLKSLDVNKTGVDPWVNMPNSTFFRRGVVGDWKNYFSADMASKVDKITESKLEGTGLGISSGSIEIEENENESENDSLQTERVEVAN